VFFPYLREEIFLLFRFQNFGGANILLKTPFFLFFAFFGKTFFSSYLEKSQNLRAFLGGGALL
jgi:hypothetical protein